MSASAELLRQPLFRAYSIFGALSGLAASLLQALILWQVYVLTGSVLSLGLVGLVAFIATSLSSLVGGAVADSYDRRAVLLVSQIGTGVASLIMLASIATQQVTLGLVYILVFLSVIASSLESPSRQALLPEVVPPPYLLRALTLHGALNSGTSVTGPVLAGFVIAAGGVGAAYLAHAALIAVATVALVPLRVSAQPAGGRLSLQLIRDGVDFVRTRPTLLGAMTLDMLAVLFGGARALLPVYAVDVLHADAFAYGVLAASMDAGTLAMAAILIAMPPVRKAGRVLLLGVVAFGLATVVFGISESLPLSIAAYAVVGMADQISMVMRRSIIQLSTANALRGRVSGVTSIFISASNELGALESGLVAAATGAVFAVVSGGLACIVVVALIAWLVPDLRKYESQG